jgi:hypothetical protein
MGKRDGGTADPYEERRLRTRNKLCAALERLVAGRPIDPTLRKVRYRLTVSTLAREANVGRNAIYTNHRVLVEELHHATLQDSQSPRGRAKNKLDEQRALIDVMKVAERRLVTENAVLLKRALDAEAEADRHRKHNARLVAERDAALRPLRIASKRG